ncbi:hypothetical protein EAI_11072 [Harpegnathos saltator]|uniref:Uncharacterized protein n=1 Tax=Harpegnathos saltator TaxID=610380 RepID=E2BFA4_HARSA|nr:hypothetical protein EAI_11072 [Harpegnathos saltator]
MADESQQSQQPVAKGHRILSHLPIAIKVLEVASIQSSVLFVKVGVRVGEIWDVSKFTYPANGA